jgi:NTE family protein
MQPSEQDGPVATDEDPNGAEDAVRQGLGLCLSGGGYRAALFHLGALRRLNELGVLARVDTIASVSGGSIASAFVAGKLARLALRDGVYGDWEGEIAAPFRRFARRNIRTSSILQIALPWNWLRPGSQTRKLESYYRRHVTGQSLHQLPERPRFVFCATDMMFGVNWVFGRDRVGDYQVGYFKRLPDWPVARAVAASSCFPPPFHPMHVKLKAEQLTAGKATAKGRYADIISRLKLTDGGVYDNMGLEPVWKSHADLLISDGGGTFKFEPDDHVLERLGKYASIATNQVSALRRRWLFDRERYGTIRFARWHVGSAVANYDPDAPGYSRDLAKQVIRHIRTDMDCFSHAEIAVLENQGYMVADAALRKHAGHLLDPARQAPLVAPHPAWMDEDKAAKALARSHKRFPITGRYRWFH